MARESIIRKYGKNIPVNNDYNYIDKGDKKHPFKSWVGASSNDDEFYNGEQVERGNKETKVLENNTSKLSSFRRELDNYIKYLIHGGKVVKKPLYYKINPDILEIEFCDASQLYFLKLFDQNKIDKEELTKVYEELEIRKLQSDKKSKKESFLSAEAKREERKSKTRDKKTTVKREQTNVIKRNNDGFLILISSIIVALLYYFGIF